VTSKETGLLSPANSNGGVVFFGHLGYLFEGWKPEAIPAHIIEYLNTMEDLFVSLGGRPHWGKYFNADKYDFRKLYPGWERFWQIRDQFDPDRIFWNAYAARLSPKNNFIPSRL